MNVVKGIVGADAVISTPKYHQIKLHILSGMESGEFEPGSKLPSENELSRLFGVNQNTAKKALRELEIEGHIFRIQGKGSFAALKEEKRTLTRTVALVVNDVRDPFYSQIASKISAIAESTDYHTMFCDTAQSFEILRRNITSLLNARKIDGFIACPTELSTNDEEHEFYKRLRNKGIPFVLIYPQRVVEFANSAAGDSEWAGYLGARELIEQGHGDDIGFVSHPDFNDLSTSRKLSGFKRALRENNLEFKDEMILTAPDVSVADGHALATQLLERENFPKAFFCVSDHFAIGMMAKFKASGLRVPEDAAFIAAGNHPQDADPEVRLTTIETNLAELSERAMRVLLGEIDHGIKNTVENIIIEPQLIKRGSC